MKELTLQEQMNIDGGFNWELVAGGTSLVVGVVAVAAATPVALPVLVSGFLCGASALGGFAAGYGLLTD